jgi:cytidine deaminase
MAEQTQSMQPGQPGQPGQPVIDELDLIARARAARARAYAPYSSFHVGCALHADGQVYEGANMENASYGLCLCAERSALARAVFAGARRIDAVAVSSESSPPATPCGMCLQSLLEFCEDPGSLRVFLVNERGERRDFALSDLLPHGFTKHQLGTARP